MPWAAHEGPVALRKVDHVKCVVLLQKLEGMYTILRETLSTFQTSGVFE